MEAPGQYSAGLENQSVPIKLKLSALWTAVMFFYVYGDYFSFYTPQYFQEFLSGDVILDSPVKLLIASVVMAIPASMIFLSLILKPRLNRFLNLIFGSLYTAMMLLIGVMSISPWWSFYVFYAFAEAAITMTIVWYAWHWPKEQIANR